jgi:hypothetical protein
VAQPSINRATRAVSLHTGIENSAAIGAPALILFHGPGLAGLSCPIPLREFDVGAGVGQTPFDLRLIWVGWVMVCDRSLRLCHEEVLRMCDDGLFKTAERNVTRPIQLL